MAWITTVLGAVVSRFLTLFTLLVGYQLAKRLALATGFIVASAGLFVAMAGSIKALVMGVRVAMPPLLAQFTYFLPPSINTFLASVVTVRLMHFVWAWTQKNLAVYTNMWGSGEGKYF